MTEHYGSKQVWAYDWCAENISVYAKELGVDEETIVKALIDIAEGIADMSERYTTDVIREHIWGYDDGRDE